MADRRSIMAALAVAGLLAIGSAEAAPKAKTPAAPQGPYILADAETGAVFEHSDALRPWYPASTTKLMTVYVAFRAIRAGEATMDTPVIVSATAAAEPPSKMGFQPGTVLTLENAIRIMMVKSANDIAMAVAETIGGSQAGFAARMNAEAARIGMSRSHFVNPHGLPDTRQVTTARDMALLARTLLVDFPEYRDYLKIHAIRFGDKTLKNYNTLIARYPGATGMKTGFICASGFNLVASARRNGREVIAVVFGAYGGTDRTERAAALLDAGFKSGGLFGKSRTNLDNVSSGRSYTTPIDMRPYICSGKRAASASEADETSGEGKAQRTSLGPPIYLGPPVQVSIISSGSVSPSVKVAKAGYPRLPRPRPDRPGFQSPGVANAFAPKPADPDDPLAAVIDATRNGGPPTLQFNGN